MIEMQPEISQVFAESLPTSTEEYTELPEEGMQEITTNTTWLGEDIRDIEDTYRPYHS